MEIFTPEDIARCLKRNNGEWIASYGDCLLRSVFQPIWDKNVSEIYGFEALIRVKQNGREIDPLTYFSQFTDHTEITNIGALCGSLHIRNFALARIDCKLFINTHPSMFAMISKDTYSTAKVLERISEEDLVNEQIVWEITEFKTYDTEKFVTGVTAFREQGNQVAIDDFGQLESNEYRVRALNPDIVKIDRSLIHTYCYHNDRKFLPGLLKMLHNRGHKIILEGVENEYEYRTLHSLPFDMMQGFYAGTPNSISHWIKSLDKAMFAPRYNANRDINPYFSY